MTTIYDPAVVARMYQDDSELEKRIQAWLRHGTNGRPLHEWIAAEVLKHPFRRVLDAGCGTGTLTRTLLDAGRAAEVTLCDLSEGVLRAAQRLNPEARGAVRGDAEHLPFASAAFDLVVACQMLHHVADLPRALRELMRLVAPGGALVVTASDYHLDAGLNRIHYATLDRLGFPAKMRDRTALLRWSAQTARDLVEPLAESMAIDRYENAMRFRTVEDAMSYYTSAMMFRQSLGLADPDIAPERWEVLRDEVSREVRARIEADGELRVPGDVVAFTLIRAPVASRLTAYFRDHAERMDVLQPLARTKPGIIDLYPQALGAMPGLLALLPSSYAGINVSLANPLQSLLPYRDQVASAHGSSVKRALRDGRPHAHILAEDLEKARQLGPGLVINYDLFCGQWVPLGDSFGECREGNVREIASRLGTEPTEVAILRRLVDDILAVYDSSEWSIRFELPGSRGFSMFAPFSEDVLDVVAERVEGTRHGVCVDVGHLLTWKTPPAEIDALLDRHGHLVKMLHISSAGSDRPSFADAYEAFHGPTPEWHHQGLDLMLPVDDDETLHLVERFRARADIQHEVCESRFYGACIDDYFPGLQTEDRMANFEAELRRQAVVLGYAA